MSEGNTEHLIIRFCSLQPFISVGNDSSWKKKKKTSSMECKSFSVGTQKHPLKMGC